MSHYGKTNSNYKDGHTTYQHYCKDCNKSIHFDSIRCQSCQITLMNKKRWKKITFRQKMIQILSQKAKKRLKNPKNNPNWKGGKQQKLRPRLTKKYKIWRNEVFKRDNFTCQKCNKKGGKLEAHHVKSWTLYSKLRFIVSNGITYCYKCHHQKGYKLK